MAIPPHRSVGRDEADKDILLGRLFRLRYKAMVIYNCHFDLAKNYDSWDKVCSTAVIVSTALLGVGYGMSLKFNELPKTASSLPTLGKLFILVPALVSPLQQTVFKTSHKTTFHTETGHRYQDLYDSVNLTWERVIDSGPSKEAEEHYYQHLNKKSELDRASGFIPDSVWETARNKIPQECKPEETHRSHQSLN